MVVFYIKQIYIGIKVTKVYMAAPLISEECILGPQASPYPKSETYV